MERFGAQKPRFEITGENSAGYPVYEKKKSEENERIPGELTEDQQVDLSVALRNIGSPNVPKKNR